MANQRTVTPHFYKGALKAWHQEMNELRNTLRTVRALRLKNTFLSLEDAQGHLDMAWHTHNNLRLRIRDIRSWKVEKYSNLSTNAKNRKNNG